MAVNTLAACLMMATQAYGVPPAAVIGIMAVERGRAGYESTLNSNGTRDLGIMQINSRWIPQLASTWNVTPSQAYRLVRDDGCVNIRVGTWILHRRIAEAGSLWLGIAHYHSRTPYHGYRYATRVVRAMEQRGLVKR